VAAVKNNNCVTSTNKTKYITNIPYPFQTNL